MNTLSTDIHIFDITKEDLNDLSTIVSQWQKNQWFMRFLKESPMTPKQNLEIFKKEFDTPHCMIKWIKLDWIKEVVWFLLFHCFNASKNELELGFRIDPLLQQKWICTQTTKDSIVEVLSQDIVSSIVWRHSAFNKWSFGVFRKSWFQIADFIPDQTFLPNLWKITDDFKWQISNKDTSIDLNKEEKIKSWLKKHNLILSV